MAKKIRGKTVDPKLTERRKVEVVGSFMMPPRRSIMPAPVAMPIKSGMAGVMRSAPGVAGGFSAPRSRFMAGHGGPASSGPVKIGSRYFGAAQTAGSTWFEIGGTPSAPTLEKTVAIAGADTTFRCSGGILGGRILAGGQKQAVGGGPGLWLSQDDGDTWVDITGSMPNTTNRVVAKMGTIADGTIYIFTRGTGGGVFDLLHKYTPGGVLSTIMQPFVEFGAGNGEVAGPAASDASNIYSGHKSGGGPGRTMYFNDGSSNFQADLPTVAPYSLDPVPRDCHVIGTKAYYLGTDPGAVGPPRLFGGSGTSFSVEFSFPATVDFNQLTSRHMGSDELGALWMMVEDVPGSDVYRRDPDTGVTSLHTANVLTSQVRALAVVDSEDILAIGTLDLAWWDGTTWNRYSYVGDLGWTLSPFSLRGEAVFA